MASWKRDFASGLIILVPLLVTVVVLAWIYNRLAQIPLPVESEPVRVLLSIVIFVLLVFSVGYLMRTAVGSVMEHAIDDMMNQLPGLRVIYNASKMAVETALSGTSDLQAPVRLEVWDGLRMTAFKTGKRTADGKEVLFLPTAPNITTGFVIEVDSDRYDEIEDSVEDALTRLLSAGFGEKNDNSESAIRDVMGGGSPTGGPREVPVHDAVGETSGRSTQSTGDGPPGDLPASGSDGTASGGQKDVSEGETGVSGGGQPDGSDDPDA